MVVHAAKIVSGGFPNDAGRTLARYVIEHSCLREPDLVIDVSGLPPALLISGFYNAFLQLIYEAGEALLDKAARIRWKHDYDFQHEAALRTIADFQPTAAVLV